MNIPNDYLDQQFFLRSDDMLGEYGVEVMVFKTNEQLNHARHLTGVSIKSAKAAAGSFLYNEPDDEGTIAIMMLSLEDLELSLVSHEATHIALHVYGIRHLRRKPKSMAHAHIVNHTEELPEAIGNMTAYVWWNLRSNL